MPIHNGRHAVVPDFNQLKRRHDAVTAERQFHWHRMPRINQRLHNDTNTVDGRRGVAVRIRRANVNINGGTSSHGSCCGPLRVTGGGSGTAGRYRRVLRAGQRKPVHLERQLHFTRHR